MPTKRLGRGGPVSSAEGNVRPRASVAGQGVPGFGEYFAPSAESEGGMAAFGGGDAGDAGVWPESTAWHPIAIVRTSVRVLVFNSAFLSEVFFPRSAGAF